MNYVNMRTSDHFWKKIFTRTAEDVRAVLIAEGKSGRSPTPLCVSGLLRDLLGINDEFVAEHRLAHIRLYY
jgi:hypothetical protein